MNGRKAITSAIGAATLGLALMACGSTSHTTTHTTPPGQQRANTATPAAKLTAAQFQAKALRIFDTVGNTPDTISQPDAVATLVQASDRFHKLAGQASNTTTASDCVSLSADFHSLAVDIAGVSPARYASGNPTPKMKTDGAVLQADAAALGLDGASS